MRRAESFLLVAAFFFRIDFLILDYLNDSSLFYTFFLTVGFLTFNFFLLLLCSLCNSVTCSLSFLIPLLFHHKSCSLCFPC